MLDGAVLQCSEISYPKKNITHVWMGSPGLTSYNARKGNSFPSIDDLIIGLLKRVVLIQEKVTRV